MQRMQTVMKSCRKNAAVQESRTEGVQEEEEEEVGAVKKSEVIAEPKGRTASNAKIELEPRT